MPIRAENDPRYSRRFLIMGIVAIGVSLWFLYDGAITYPNQRERALAHKKLEEETKGGDPRVFRDRWHEIASEHNWSTAYPGEPKSEGEIIMQFVMAAIAVAAGLLLVSIPLRSRGRWIELSDAGLASSWGQTFNFDQVASLDKRKWRSKGIAKVAYQDGRRQRRFVIDDYKFDRFTTDTILYELEQRIDPALITGGPPEPPPEEYGDEAAAAAE